MSGTSGQSINPSGVLKNLKWWQATIMIVSILLAGSLFVHEGGQLSINVDIQARVQAIENRIDIPVNSSLSAFLKSNTYMVSLVDAYACLMNGSNAHLQEFLTDHTQVINDALGNASIVGGSVYVATGAYTSLGVIVQNNTRLIIETGATGITYSIASGATCIVDDFNTWLSKYYKNGVLQCQFDYAGGNLLVASVNMSQLLWNGQNRTDAIANPTGPYNYLISTDDTNYSMKNSTTGQILQSTSFDSLLDSAMNNCSGNSGNLIYLGPGIFWVTRPHGIIKSNMTVEGSGPDSTIIKLANGANCDIFNQTNIAAAPSNPFFTVRDLTLDGNWGNNAYGCGINIGDASRSLCPDLCMYNVWVTYFNGWGIIINGTWSPTLERCIVENCKYGVYFYATEGSVSQSFFSYNTYVGMKLIGDGCRIENTGFWRDGNEGLWIYSTKRSVISGNSFEMNSYLHQNVYSSIQMNGTTFNNTISGNSVDGQNYPKYNLDMSTGTNTDNTITANAFSTANTSSVNPASGNYFYANAGFVTEHDVSANNVTSTTFSFLHGLAGTPTSLSIQFNSAAVRQYSWTANSTGISITITSYGGSWTPNWIKPFWQMASGTNAGVINRTFIQPIMISANCTVDQIAAMIGVLSAGQNCRLGIYADNAGTPYGGALLYDSGNLSVAAIQAVYGTVSSLNLKAGTYWVAIQTSDATQAFFRDSTNFNFAGLANVMMGGCYFDSATFGLATTCPAVTSLVSARPIIMLHVSAWDIDALPSTITCTCHVTYAP